MATLTVRNLPQDVYDRLRVRAAENKRSMEAEARAALIEASSAARKRQDAEAAAQAVRNLRKLMEKVKPKRGESLVDEFLAERRAMWGEEE